MTIVELELELKGVARINLGGCDLPISFLFLVPSADPYEHRCTPVRIVDNDGEETSDDLNMGSIVAVLAMPSAELDNWHPICEFTLGRPGSLMQETGLHRNEQRPFNAPRHQHALCDPDW